MSDAISIVMIEDDEGHARLIEKNIRRAGVQNPIVHLKDGTSALRYLFGGPDGTRPTHESSLILLDLNLPDMRGIEVLRKIKDDPVIRSFPVIILTTTDDRLEIQRCYDLGCNMYVTKPMGYQQFAEAVRTLGLFLSVLQMPEPLHD